MKIFQIVSDLSYGDAVSNDVFAVDDVLKEYGYDTEIYAGFYSDKRIKKKIKPINSIYNKISSEDVVIYHLCIGTEITDWFKKLNCIKILRYHNITPPEFFYGYNDKLIEITRFGRQSVFELAGNVDFAICDSEYNRQELIDCGFKNTCSVPVIIKFDDYRQKSSEEIIKRYNDDKKNILFVGRSAPNKKIEDIIIAFDYYKKNINNNCRLILIGSDSVPSYTEKLEELINNLGTDDIIRPGHIKFDEILGFYKSADLFLCMSEHEGFCVPLLEAMYFDVPVIAYNAAAVPETLGKGGIVFKNKNFAKIGEIMNLILNDEKLKDIIIKNQRERLRDFEYDKVKKRFVESIREVLPK